MHGTQSVITERYQSLLQNLPVLRKDRGGNLQATRLFIFSFSTMNALNTTRASAKCYALARQRLVSHGQYNNYRRSTKCCFSSLQHDTQLKAPTIDRDDDDEQHNKMQSRSI